MTANDANETKQNSKPKRKVVIEKKACFDKAPPKNGPIASRRIAIRGGKGRWPTV